MEGTRSTSTKKQREKARKNDESGGERGGLEERGEVERKIRTSDLSVRLSRRRSRSVRAVDAMSHRSLTNADGSWIFDEAVRIRDKTKV